MLKEIVEKIQEAEGLSKAALTAVRDFIKKNYRGKLTTNYPGYEWQIGGSVEQGDVVIQKSFKDLIDIKSRKQQDANGGYNEYIGYAGKDGTGIQSIASWNPGPRAKTRIYFVFTDSEKSDASKVGMI